MKETIKISALLLGRDDVLDEIEKLQPESEQSASLKLLVRLANLVIREVAEEYLPLLCTEKAGSDSECRLHFENLSNTFLKAVWVKDSLKQKIVFSTYPTFLKLPKPFRFYEVCYQYLPEYKELDDFHGLGSTVTSRILAYGIAAEFCMTELMFDEAMIWDTRFKSSLQNALKKARGVHFRAG